MWSTTSGAGRAKLIMIAGNSQLQYTCEVVGMTSDAKQCNHGLETTLALE
jgi:hypothetical protein